MLGSSPLALRAAELSWEPGAAPVSVGRVVLRAGRPCLERTADEILGDGGGGAWGVVACGPRVLVEDARRAAAGRGARFHAEEFAW